MQCSFFDSPSKLSVGLVLPLVVEWAFVEEALNCSSVNPLKGVISPPMCEFFHGFVVTHEVIYLMGLHLDSGNKYRSRGCMTVKLEPPSAFPLRLRPSFVIFYPPFNLVHHPLPHLLFDG